MEVISKIILIYFIKHQLLIDHFFNIFAGLKETIFLNYQTMIFSNSLIAGREQGMAKNDHIWILLQCVEYNDCASAHITMWFSGNVVFGLQYLWHDSPG